MTIRLCRSSPLIQETGGRMNFQPVHVWGSVHHEIFFLRQELQDCSLKLVTIKKMLSGNMPV